MNAKILDATARRTLLERRLFERAKLRRIAPAVPVLQPDLGSRYEPFALTPVQQAYWIGRKEHFQLGGIAAHYYLEILIPGSGVSDLEEAFNRLIIRHDMLRAIFLKDGQQKVLPKTERYYIKTGPLADTLEANSILEVRDEMAHQRFDSEVWPLFEVRVSPLKDGQRLLHVSLDFLICDAWSLFLLGRELQELLANPNQSLPAIDISFRDHVIETERSRMTSEYKRAESYWESRIGALPSGPDLPLARRPQELKNPRFKRRAMRIEPEHWEQLARTAANVGITQSAILCSALCEVLARWSKSRKFTLNITQFDRRGWHPHIFNVVGDFTSLIPLAVDFSAQQSFHERTAGLQVTLLEALEHRLVSGVELMRKRAALLKEEPLSLPVVFTSTLAQANRGETLSNRLGTAVYGISQTPQVWLDNQISYRDGGLDITWDAVEDLFPAGLLEEMWAAYGRLIQSLQVPAFWAVQQRAELPSSQIEVRNRVNHVPAPLPEERIHEGLHRYAKLTPDHIWIWSPEECVTYSQADEVVGRAAGWLTAAGVEPGDIVAIVMPKSAAQVLAAVSVIEAGGAFLPIDSELPPERISELVQLGKVRCVITTAAVRRRIAMVDEIQWLDWDDSRRLSNAPAKCSKRDPDSVAYIIFTSGSTGVPKGVVISHRAALNTIRDVNRRFAVGADDAVFAISALTFDLSIYDVFGTLEIGGKLILPSSSQRRDPEHWLQVLRDGRATIWNSAPPLMQLLLDQTRDRPDEFPSTLRTVLLSGDWIPLDMPERLRCMNPNIRVVSLGGATEAAIWSVYHEVAQVDPSWASIPYGKPLANQSLHVLDELYQPCPDWATGMIYIGGAGLAKGYHLDKEKTRSSFLTLPGFAGPLYRTGDLGRYHPNGDIEILGREDFQVKINGHRIELGEVESKLESHPGVARALSLAEGSGQRKKLIAFYSAAGEETPSEIELRTYLLSRLPHYMVPVRIVAVREFPLTTSGKIDRRKLLSSWQAAPAQSSASESSPTEVKKQLKQLWCTLLKRDQVDTSANFFELGGDSILALRMVQKVEETLGISLPIVSLYHNPTIGMLAREIEGALQQKHQSVNGAAETLVVGSSPEQRYAPFSLTEVQRAYWLGRMSSFKLGNTSTHSYIELGLSDLDLERMQQALNRLVLRHDMLRMVVTPEGTQKILQHVPAYSIRYQDLSSLESLERAEKMRAERSRMSAHVFDLSEWPLFEVGVIREEVHRFRILVGIDLIAIDAYSFQLLIREFLGLYTHSSEEVTPLSISFRDYVLAIENSRALPAYTKARDYWQGRLKSLPSAPRLPMENIPESIAIPTFVGLRTTVSEGDWTEFKSRAAQAGVTPSTAICTLFSDVLGEWSASTHFTLNLTTFGRQILHPDIERMLGDFTTTTLLEVKLGSTKFRDRARAIQQQIWRDLEHKTYSGIEVLRELRKQRAAAGLMMPIVFTSIMLDGSRAVTDEAPWAEVLYSITQTPQVLLDHQIVELPGQALQINWDYVDRVFPPGVIEDMFAEFKSRIAALSKGADRWNQ